MKRRTAWHHVIIVSFALVLGLCPILHGFAVSTTGPDGTGKEIKWKTPFMAFRINPRGGPSGAVEAILAAASEWNKIEDSRFSFIYQGSSNRSASAAMDGFNVIAFANETDPIYNKTVCYNSMFYDVSTGELLENDINFNTNYPITTDDSISAFDLQNIATHVLGHSLSLADLCSKGTSCGPDDPQLQCTMYANLDAGETKKRTLEDDDIAGMKYLYPGFGVKAEKFLIDGGAEKITRRLVLLQIVALNDPSEYQISEYSDFRDAGWRPFRAISQFLLTPGAGIKTVYLKLRRGVEEPATISCAFDHQPHGATIPHLLLQK